MYLSYLILVSIAFCAGTFTEHEGILELTQSDFEIAKNQFENLFVEFYATWCGHCRSIAPEYEKAAQFMRDEGFPVTFAKVNADEHVGLRDEFKVTGYPTFKFFLDSGRKIIDFSAGRHSSDFVGFIKKKVASPVHVVEIVEDGDSIVKYNEITFFGFFKDAASDAAMVYRDFAFDHDKFIFIATFDSSITEHFHAQSDAVMVFKQYDEGKVQMAGDITYANLKQFLTHNQLPLVNEFLEENAEKIFSTDIKNYMVLFVYKQSAQFENILNNFKLAAHHFIGRVVFLYVDLDEEEHEKVLEFFGVSPAKCPAVRFINMTSVDPVKYNPSSPDLDPQSMQSFANSVLLGQVKPFYKSEEVPSNWDQTVKVLVGTTFDNFIANAPQNVIVNFYVPWCGHCKKMMPIWEELGEKFAGKVIVSKVDSSLNEVPSLKVEQFPTIKLFIRESKEVIEYTGERTLSALVEFIESDGQVIRVPEVADAGNSPKDEL